MLSLDQNAALRRRFWLGLQTAQRVGRAEPSTQTALHLRPVVTGWVRLYRNPHVPQPHGRATRPTFHLLQLPFPSLQLDLLCLAEAAMAM